MKKQRIALLLISSFFTAAFAGCGSNHYTTVVDSEAPAAPIEEETESAFVLSDATSFATIGKREETVNVEADANGTPKEITVETKLSGIGAGDAVRDRTVLSDIKNHHGDEEWIEEADSVVLQNLGEDIVYEGTADASLPVEVSVTYFLEGKEIAPEELAGKSGHVKLRFDYENKEKRGDVYVPFACISAALLSADTFSEIEVTNGRVVELDDTMIAVGLAFPKLRESLAADASTLPAETKLPEFVEIEAEAKDFSLDFTATVVTNGLFSDEEEEEESDELKAELETILGVAIPDFSELTGDNGDSSAEVDVSRESSAIRNHLSALSQSILASPTLSEAEKAAMLSDLTAVGNNFRTLGNKLSGLGDSLSDSLSEYEDLSDAIEDFKTRRAAVEDADRSYKSYAGTDASIESSVRFLIETEKIAAE